MDNINNAPVQEPVNQAVPKKKLFEKPQIFMIIAIFVGNIFTYLDDSTSKILETDIRNFANNGFLPYSVSSVISSIGLAVLDFSESVLPLAVYVIFAIFAYKKLRKSARFFGIAFFANAAAGLIPVVSNSILSVFNGIFAMKAVGLFVSGFAEIIGMTIDSISVIIAAAIGVFLLLIVDGKIELKKKEKEDK